MSTLKVSCLCMYICSCVCRWVCDVLLQGCEGYMMCGAGQQNLIRVALFGKTKMREKCGDRGNRNCLFYVFFLQLTDLRATPHEAERSKFSSIIKKKLSLFFNILCWRGCRKVKSCQQLIHLADNGEAFWSLHYGVFQLNLDSRQSSWPKLVLLEHHVSQVS